MLASLVFKLKEIVIGAPSTHLDKVELGTKPLKPCPYNMSLPLLLPHSICLMYLKVNSGH